VVDRRYIHTGDFRYYNGLCSHDIFKHPIDILYLDNTYANPKHCFPPQEKVIDTLAQLIRKLESGKSIETVVKNQKTIMSWLEPAQILKKPKILLALGTYTIGKEKIALGLAREFGHFIYASPSKRELLDLLDDFELNSRMISDPKAAGIHLIKMDELNKVCLNEIALKNVDIDVVVGIRPTVSLYILFIGMDIQYR
jgi:DNA cross-link repair 1A protein